MEGRSHSQGHCMKPLLCRHFKWITNKQRGSRRSVWKISATFTAESRPEESRLPQEQLLKKKRRAAWPRRSTYSHNRMPFSSADRKSLLPNVFLVTSCKKKGGGGGRREQKTVSKLGPGLCDDQRLWFACRVGRLEKKGRMLRTVPEEVRGISSSCYSVLGP